MISHLKWRLVGTFSKYREISLTTPPGILLLVVGMVAGQEQDYCQLSAEHTMCRYQGLGPACLALSHRGVASQEAKIITDTHNR